MNKVIGIACAAVCAAFVGCKSVPSAEQMYTVSHMIGASAGLVADNMDTNVHATVEEIVKIVAEVTPETNQTFEAAWTPIAQKHVDELVEAGKLTKDQGTLVMSSFVVVVKGIDYVFENRYPEARQYKELVASAINGFTKGFLATFNSGSKEESQKSRAVCTRVEYDNAAWEYLVKFAEEK